MKLRSVALFTLTYLIANLSIPATAVPIKVRAAVINGAGDVKPVARRQFFAFPYSVSEFERLMPIAHKYGLGKPPDPSQYIRQVIIDHGDRVKYYIDPKYKTDFKVWKDRVVSKFKQVTANDLRQPIKFQTDLGGEATVDLPPGKWYISGFYSNAFSSLRWDVPVAITKSTRLIELSNDNSSQLVELEPKNIEDRIELTRQGKERQSLKHLSFFFADLKDVRYMDREDRAISYLSGKYSLQEKGDPQGYRFYGNIAELGVGHVYANFSDGKLDNIVLVVQCDDKVALFSKFIEVSEKYKKVYGKVLRNPSNRFGFSYVDGTFVDAPGHTDLQLRGKVASDFAEGLCVGELENYNIREHVEIKAYPRENLIAVKLTHHNLERSPGDIQFDHGASDGPPRF